MSILRLDNLGSRCLAPVTLTLNTGECVCLSGPSGSGKTALLRAIADLDPHTGTAYLDETGCHTVSAPEWRRWVGLLPAESHWWHERVAEHFNNGHAPWFDRLGLRTNILNRRLLRLSTGERQRLALARLLSNAPRALLLDEPTASLDTKNTRRVEALIAEYRHEHGAPVLWISHDTRQIKRIADRLLRIQGDRLVVETLK